MVWFRSLRLDTIGKLNARHFTMYASQNDICPSCKGRAQCLERAARHFLMLPSLLREHAGRFALMRRGEVVECLDTFADAVRLGARLFADRLFSVQEVTDQSIELGFFSLAIDHPVR